MSTKKAVKKINKSGEETVYESIRAAADSNFTSRANISRVLNGVNKTCLGCRWEVVVQ